MNIAFGEPRRSFNAEGDMLGSRETIYGSLRYGLAIVLDVDWRTVLERGGKRNAT